MLKKAPQTKLHIVILFAISLILLINVFAVKELDFFDIPIFFVMAIMVELLFIMLFFYELIQVLQTPLKIIWSLLFAAWKGIQQNNYFLRARRQYPALFKWIGERFSIKSHKGLILTIGVLMAIFFLGLFLGIAEDVQFKDLIISVDQRILNLMPRIRTGEQTEFFSFVTFLANWQSVIFTSLITLIFLLRKKQKFTGILYASSLISAEGSVFLLKHIFGRARPSPALSLIFEDGFSFPSGHAVAGTVMFGFLAYLIIKSINKPRRSGMGGCCR